MKYFYELYADTPNRQQFADDFKSSMPTIEEIEESLKDKE